METQVVAWSIEGGFGALTESAGRSRLALLFGADASSLEPARAAVRALAPDAVITGCSSAGSMHGSLERGAFPGIVDEPVVVALVRFDHTDVRAVSAEVGAQGSLAAGRTLADGLADPALRHVFVLSDGLAVNGTELAQGLRERLPGVVVTGGLAGDGSRFERTVVVDDDGVRPGIVRAIGLYGDRIRVGHGSRGGWEGFGLERTVTRSNGNVLLELDGQPALALYEEYLGDRASGLPATGLLFPLSLPGRHDVVRTILAVDREAQSLTFAGDIPQGARVRLMRAGIDRLVEAAGAAADQAAVPDSSLALAVSCVGRRLVLGPRAEEEVDRTVDHLPAGTALAGFYSYGELSPTPDGACDLHNQTMTLTTWSEA